VFAARLEYSRTHLNRTLTHAFVGVTDIGEIHELPPPHTYAYSRLRAHTDSDARTRTHTHTRTRTRSRTSTHKKAFVGVKPKSWVHQKAVQNKVTWLNVRRRVCVCVCVCARDIHTVTHDTHATTHTHTYALHEQSRAKPPATHHSLSHSLTHSLLHRSSDLCEKEKRRWCSFIRALTHRVPRVPSWNSHRCVCDVWVSE